MLLKNETKGDEMVDIMTHIHQYVPCISFSVQQEIDTEVTVEVERANMH